jgi:hypothetical protein
MHTNFDSTKLVKHIYAEASALKDRAQELRRMAEKLDRQGDTLADMAAYLEGR